jgi:hypothetical protein
MITAEEAQDYPEEAKPVQAKPANPLDLVAPKKVEIVEEIIDPMVFVENFKQAIESEEVTAEVTEVQEAKPVQTTGSFHLYVPKKTEPHASYETLEAWQAAYEDLADKTARAGKVPARERMTILKELKEANDATLKAIDTVVRSVHTAAHLKRIKSLGATI